MEFEEPRAAACEVEFLAHAHQTPSTTFVVGHFRPIQRGFAMSGYPPKRTSGPLAFMSTRPVLLPALFRSAARRWSRLVPTRRDR